MADQTNEQRAVFNQTRRSFLSLGVTTADTPLARLVGLLGKRKLRTDEGLWVVPSHGIHTVGMIVPIDVIYLDERQRVIHLIEHLGPFRVGPVRLDCASVLELPVRTIYASQTQLHDDLLICSYAEIEHCWRTLQTL